MTPRPLRFSTDPSELRGAQLAAAVSEQLQALDDLGPDAAAEEVRSLLRKLGEASLAIARWFDADLTRVAEVERQFEILGPMLEVPQRLGAVGETDLAVRVAQALSFCAYDDLSGQVALAYAQVGDRERALTLVLKNLETAREPFIAEFRAGDVYRELGEADAAEAYYRRSLALASSASARREVSLRIASLLIDTGRESAAVAFLAEQRASASERDHSEPALPDAREAPKSTDNVGRNEPCPCGSGKKYKKCHGA